MIKGGLLFSIFCLAASLQATTYYVANSGNDTNSGTSPGDPFLTIQHAADIVVPGDSVIVADGDYVGFYQSTGGTAGAPIVFFADGNAVRITSPTTTTDGINVEGADWIEINGFIVDDQPRNGVRLVDADNCIVRNCSCDNNGERGIFTGSTDDILIEYNVCTNSIDEHGIYVSNSSDRSIIRYNVCYGNNASGIQINADTDFPGDGISSNARVYGNILYDNGTSGGAAINFDGVQDSRVHNNLIFGNHATGIALFQINGEEPSHRDTIVHNTIIQPSDGRWCILIVNGSTGTKVYNNILINLHEWRGGIALDDAEEPGFDSDYNILDDHMSNDGDGTWITFSDWQGLGYDANALLAEAPEDIFVNPDFSASGDYHLLPMSQPVEAGNAALAYGVTTDLDGNMRPIGLEHDIGAYEETSIILALEEEKDTTTQHSIIRPTTVIATPNGLRVENAPLHTSITVCAMSGRHILKRELVEGTNVLPLPDLPAGLYVWILRQKSGLLKARGFHLPTGQ